MMDTHTAVSLFFDLAVIGMLLLGIWLFGAPHTARRGNMAAALALAGAAGLILMRNGAHHPWLLLFCLLAGSSAGYVVARKVDMIQIPAMVAFQHGAGGVAAFMLSFAELMRGAGRLGVLNEISGLLGLAIGALTFSGSLVAAGKLANKLRQAPVFLSRHTRVTLMSLSVILGLIIAAMVMPETGRPAVYLLLILVSALFGIVFSMRIGGADMPVLISFLNATAGVAAAFCGMIIENKLLISCGATVAASGSILTHVMCRAMNRSLLHVFLPKGRPQPVPPGQRQERGEKEKNESGQKWGHEENQPVVDRAGAERGEGFSRALEHAANAQRVIIVPGYGMAVAQAQFALLELAGKLMAMGKSVKFAIHPVAGRMPGHMNVLLAEAGIDYDLLVEMDEINPEFSKTDLTLVVGACDVVNPAAIEVDGSPISGMPILLTHESKAVVCCNLDSEPGYSGVENPLYGNGNTIMLMGDAKESVQHLADHLLDMPVGRPGEPGTPGMPDGDPAGDRMETAVNALAAAKRIIVIPGYGMAVAQAQFKVAELAALLEQRGADVKFAIHPVAGRMPGHMNVLLAEAEVDYEDLCEMDEINPEFQDADVAIVFGACDVVNPAAMESEGTPISGMPILSAHEAGRVIVCNFNADPGYSGVKNTLYEDPKTLFLQGDAGSTAGDLIYGLKTAN
ncbi:MAG: NAD(P)(+) transhydrogenase (Re/Si-specific) subunit beta [Desulfobacter sp.]|nr:MAG: NAD(P)(+) transhydrogenase (Re/Si-specific) subunit beta [Desulfobacter sp.]